MKTLRSLCVTFAVLLCLVLFAAPKAEATTYGKLTYTIINGEVTITDCNTSATGELVIPDTLEGYPVTTIGSYAFSSCASLISVTIPDSVTTIGNSAFSYCTSLTSIAIGDSVTTIDSSAFNGCSKLQYNVYDNGKYLGNAKNPYLYLISATSTAITECAIHNDTKIIGPRAFDNCTSLTSITIPDSVTTIGDYAFYNCYPLTHVYITDVNAWCKISFHGYYANPMDYAEQLHILDENGVEVTEIVLDDSVTQIPNYAFEGCTSLTGVTIGDSVTTIGSSAFEDCTRLTNVYYHGTESQWNQISIGSDNSPLENAKKHYSHIHDYTIFPKEVIAPTCLDYGYTKVTCIYGDTAIVDIVPSLGHDYSGQEVIVEPGCLTDGYKGPGCTRCDSIREDTVLPASGHKPVLIPVCDATCTEKGVKTAGTQCSRCEIYFLEPEWIPALGHSFTNYISNNDATIEKDGTKTAMCDRCEETDTVADPGTKLKHGWENRNDKWYFYEYGVMVTNDWRKDSIGWCFLGADGAMATNQWIADSKGWCYVESSGYCATNCWKKDSVGWVWLDSEGSMVKNQWIKDGGKWYFLDSEGYMVSNQWRKDSSGWCWLGADGAMVTNTWVQDSKGWCYIGADGYCWTNCWAKDSVGWVYLDKEGSMVYNKWILDGGSWYYVGADGYMLSNTTWNGYKFNDSGVCTNP